MGLLTKLRAFDHIQEACRGLQSVLPIVRPESVGRYCRARERDNIGVARYSPSQTSLNRNTAAMIQITTDTSRARPVSNFRPA
ncbi:hypothetical protein PMI40_01167 [Herbaspirillum sp. YR522]|nr:hypothetical protein PMI40_01167 [Herbaspirillum sp. YR522]